MLERSEALPDNREFQIVSSESSGTEFSNISNPSSSIENFRQADEQIRSHTNDEAYLQVVSSGMQTGENMFLFKGPDDKPRMGNILHSEMFNIKSNGTGEITGYFLQYEHGYKGGDGYGIFHPGSVPDRKITKNLEGKIYQDNSERKIGYTGNETIRVLVAKYNPQTNEVERHYVKGKDLRYAIEDKRRLDEARETLKKLKESGRNADQNAKNIGKILPISTEVKLVAD